MPRLSLCAKKWKHYVFGSASRDDRCRATAAAVTENLAADRARELGRESNFLSLCRVGFIGRGVLYILIAVLVLGTGAAFVALCQKMETLCVR